LFSLTSINLQLVANHFYMFLPICGIIFPHPFVK
jgi:hypothetical protein